MMDDYDDYDFDDYGRRDRYRRSDGLTVERCLSHIAPLIVSSLLKKHQSLVLMIACADVVFEVHRQYKAKKPMGQLTLLHGDYS